MHPHIPQQREGAKHDTTAERTFDTAYDAEHFFETVKKRFQDVNSWQKVAGKGSAKFCLLNKEGALSSAGPQEGDYFKINIPALDGSLQEKADWVRVEHTEQTNTPTEEMLLVRVRPCDDPFAVRTEADHFYTDDATSTFVIHRKYNVISAEVHGRNEKPNTDGETLLDKVRNTVVAIAGMAGVAKVQWKLLTEGLLKDE